jgi:hypothetical protein
VHAELPLDEPVIAAAAAVLEGVAEGARAFWGHASPYGYGSEVAEQVRRSTHAPEFSPRGLPMLNLPQKLSAPYDNPAHLDALKRAYERFPEIGGRVAPR